MINKPYFVFNKITDNPSNESFELHSHDNYEIYLFIEGDTNYIVEGNSYSLKPYDIIVIRKHEMHRAFHNSNKRYERFAINVWPEFFERNNCQEYEKHFFDTSLGNKINSELVMSEGMYDAFMRLRKYTNNLQNIDSRITENIITEILYLISNTGNYIGADVKNKEIASIIAYLNNNFTQDICLSDLENTFFISKHYLCKIFKAATGITVHRYLTEKRISYIRELIKDGKSIGEAASLAGYNSYSSFYRAYKQEFGSSPKMMEKN